MDSTWEFQSLIRFRDDFAAEHGFKLNACSNEAGRAAGLNPFDHGDRYTLILRTEPLKTALDAGGYEAAVRPMCAERRTLKSGFGLGAERPEVSKESAPDLRFAGVEQG